MKKGTFCISIDTELLWGRRDLDLTAFTVYAKKVRSIIKKLLNLFDKYDMPATWAIVGKLFLPPKKENDLWHGKDIVLEIAKHKNQEIACHSFSHIIFGSSDCSPKRAEEEIKNCLEIAEKNNLKLYSFVFPQNSIGHLDILKKHGFICYRGNDPYWFRRFGPIKKFLQIIDFLFCLTPPTSKAFVDKKGLVNIPGSMFYVSRWGLRKFMPCFCWTIKAKKGIGRAIKQGKIFHLWFHPITLSGNDNDIKILLQGLEEILQYANNLRAQGLLEIKTMKEIAVQNSQST